MHQIKILRLWFLTFFCVIGLIRTAEAELLLVTLDYPPYEYAEGEEVKGVAVAVVREVFRRMEVDVTIQVFPWARSLKMVELGNADGIFTAYWTEDRAKFLDYSTEVLMPQEISLFVRRESPLRVFANFESLADYQFAARHGVSYGAGFDHAVSDGVLGQVHRVSDGDTVVKLLMSARADIVVFNRLGGIYRFRHMKLADRVRELTPPVQSVPSYIAFSRLRNLMGLRERVDAVLKEMKADGSYEKLTAYTLDP